MSKRWFRAPVELEEESSPVQSETAEPKTVNGIVCNSPFVNVRIGPSDKNGVITVLNQGTRVKIVSEIGEFYEIRFGRDLTGYIKTKFCKEV